VGGRWKWDRGGVEVRRCGEGEGCMWEKRGGREIRRGGGGGNDSQFCDGGGKGVVMRIRVRGCVRRE